MTQNQVPPGSEVSAELASLVRPLPSCVTMDLLLNLSMFSFEDLQKEIRGSKPSRESCLVTQSWLTL